MAFLRNYAFLDAEPVLQSGRVIMRLPVMADYAEWAQLRSASRSFLEPWEPTWPRDDLTKPAFRQRVRRYNRDMRDDYAYAFFIFCQQSGQLAGGLTLSNVRRGVAQSASVGYWVGLPFAGQGYLTDALGAAVRFAFESLQIAQGRGCVPSPQRSVPPPAPEGWFQGGRLCAAIPEDRRALAGSCAFCAAGHRPAGPGRHGRPGVNPVDNPPCRRQATLGLRTCRVMLTLRVPGPGLGG
jgi:ribosomal-protein-alanine N-acetyltransferase